MTDGAVRWLSIVYQKFTLLRQQEEFVNGLHLLYWDGVTDIIALGHNKLPVTAEFAPFKVGCSCSVSD